MSIAYKDITAIRIIFDFFRLAFLGNSATINHSRNTLAQMMLTYLPDYNTCTYIPAESIDRLPNAPWP